MSNAGVCFILVVAGLGGLLYGIDFGIIATASPYIKALKLFTDAQISWIVGAVLFGGILSSLSAGMLAERFGRRHMIIASALIFLAAVPMVCLSERSFWGMAAARVLQGMSAGYMSVILPMYLTETLPPEIRGRGTGIFQTFLIFGLVAAASVGLAVTRLVGAADAPCDVVSDAAKSLAWKINFWWTLLPVAVLFLGSLRLPESPVWVKSVKCKVESSKLKVAGSRSDNATSNLELQTSDLQSLLARRYVVPFLLVVAVLTLNKTTGMSSVTSWSVMIFHKAGFGGALGNAGDLAMKLANLAATVAATWLVDRVGRRALLKIGTAGMAAGLATVGAVFLAIERFGMAPGLATGAVALLALLVMQAFYAIGPGICVWLVLSELMPQRIRANGMSIALFMNQFVAWGLASSFLPWVNAWGWHSMFFFFAVNGAAYFAVSLFIPETKGKSLEELEHLFDKKKGDD